MTSLGRHHDSPTGGTRKPETGDRRTRNGVSRRPPFSRGFTLLELLVAMLIMVSIASCLYAALHTGFRAQRSALMAVGPTSQAVDAIDLLKQDIYGVLPPGGVMAGAFIGTDSAGVKGVDTDSLEFYTTHVYASDGEMAGGVGKIELLLEDDKEAQYGSYMLIRRTTMNLLSTRDLTPEEQILCRNVASLNFRYFDGNDWVDDWDSTADANSLPLAVEIDIQVSYDDGKRRSRLRESPKRQLIQSFTIPCETAPAEETESTDSTGDAGGSGGSGGMTAP